MKIIKQKQKIKSKQAKIEISYAIGSKRRDTRNLDALPSSSLFCQFANIAISIRLPNATRSIKNQNKKKSEANVRERETKNRSTLRFSHPLEESPHTSAPLPPVCAQLPKAESI